MDTAGLALIITAVSGALVGTATVLNNRRTSSVTSRVNDTDVAFKALNTTVETLSKENVRIQEELDEVREEYGDCEKTRTELTKIVGQQGSEISKLKQTVEELTMNMQSLIARSSSPS